MTTALGTDGVPPSLDREKARRAAANPDRPGEKCGAPPGRWLPVVDRSRCEGKHDCVDVCPYAVFEVRRIDDADYRNLGLFGRLKSSAHGRQTAYTPGAEACRACGLCVVACPEKAIRLVPRAGPAQSSDET
jgi:NAD-dependent dihydropyrimidine dehydrogenase PreA subunit